MKIYRDYSVFSNVIFQIKITSNCRLKRCIYDYMVSKNLHASAQLFQVEGGVPPESVEIGDSSHGFLLDWWSIFSDMYTRRDYGIQQSSNEDFALRPFPQEEFNSQMMENRVACSEVENANQLLQPTMTSQNVSSFNTANSIIQNNSFMNNQQSRCMSSQFGLNENMVQRSNFKSDLQHAAMHNNQIRTPQISGHPNANGSQSLYLSANQPKLNNAMYRFPANSVNLTAEKNQPRGDLQTGIAATSVNMGIQGNNLWLLNQNETNKLQIPNQRQSHPVQLVSKGKQIQPQTSDKSDQFLNPNCLSSTGSSLRKQKAPPPPYPGFGTSLYAKEIKGQPPKLKPTSIQNPASVLPVSTGHAAQYGTSSQLELPLHDGKAPGKEYDKFLNTEAANDEGHNFGQFGNAQEDSCNSKNDQNK